MKENALKTKDLKDFPLAATDFSLIAVVFI